MSARFIHEGKSIDYTPSADVTAGDVVVQGDLIGVASRSIVFGHLGALQVDGVFDFPKTAGTGEAIAVGTKVYWDATNTVATATASTHKYLGKTIAAAGDNDTLVRVRLDQ